MKRFSPWTMIVIITVIVVSTLTAQPMRRTPEERVKQLKEQLSLDAKQEKQALEIYKESDKKREAMFNEMSESDDRDAAREKMMKMVEETDKKIEKILTKEQKKKYEDLKKERQQRMGGRGERRM